MQRREFIRITSGGAIASMLGMNIHVHSAEEKKRPNLVFFFTDQQSSDMLGCNGNSQILTPNVDAFSKTALCFNHCISNNPVCTPARGILLSGQHPLYNGAICNDTQLRLQDGKAMGSILSNAGYDTCYIGKWHIYGGDRDKHVPPGPHRHGFETFYSNNCALNFMPEHAFYYDDAGNKIKYNEWEAYGQTKQAVNFIQSRKKDKPFALYLSLHPPHDQGTEGNAIRYRSIKPLMDRYRADDIQMRKNASMPAESSGKGRVPKDEQTFWKQLREDYHGYYAMCSGCDDCFGQVLEALKRAGLDENTIIVYTSDHGDLLHSHGRPWPKSFPEAESCRVPFLIRYPGVLPENQRSDLLLGTLDIMPTLLALMGLETPDTCQGTNLANVIKSGENTGPESVPLFYFAPSWRGIYTRRYTYAIDEFNGKNPLSWQVLYDRQQDPTETNNLFYSSDPEIVKVRESLQAQTQAWLDKFKDPFLSTQDLMKKLGRKKPKFNSKDDDGAFPARPIDMIRT